MTAELSKLLEKLDKIKRNFTGGRLTIKNYSSSDETKEILKKAKERLKKDMTTQQLVAQYQSSAESNESLHSGILSEQPPLREELETLKAKLEELKEQAVEFARWRKEFAFELAKKNDVIAAQEATIIAQKKRLQKYEEEIKNLNLKLASYETHFGGKKEF